ncbi:chemotaxis protein CheW [Methanomicrobium antiquum]|uniref:Chemotaxis protein CheW n=1 Tax=Methanomicrobium antiquum TaxID=487686 RepID=A0AAF0JME3_9EURY|nr:chemotaxis protein CheW [Methanomicrobium antiquum]WFN36445.1 chemotaxis protein CheW [Methanomicrobium antiquum]
MAVIDLVVFELNKTLYALDITLAREIVEMMTPTPIPRSPPHVAGIINLRGEITKIIHLCTLLDIQENPDAETRKIIILTSADSEKSKIGIIVDDVKSVIAIEEDTIDTMDNAVSKEAYVKGIIKRKSETDNKETQLVIWIDLSKVLEELNFGLNQ